MFLPEKSVKHVDYTDAVPKALAKQVLSELTPDKVKQFPGM